MRIMLCRAAFPRPGAPPNKVAAICNASSSFFVLFFGFKVFLFGFAQCRNILERFERFPPSFAASFEIQLPSKLKSERLRVLYNYSWSGSYFKRLNWSRNVRNKTLEDLVGKFALLYSVNSLFIYRRQESARTHDFMALNSHQKSCDALKPLKFFLRYLKFYYI